jgi:hypothetical protein
LLHARRGSIPSDGASDDLDDQIDMVLDMFPPSPSQQFICSEPARLALPDAFGKEDHREKSRRVPRRDGAVTDGGQESPSR